MSCPDAGAYSSFDKLRTRAHSLSKESEVPDIANSNRPLAGLRVIDIATYIAAPYCATIMAEFGAEVIKVEMPKVGDPCRRLGI